MNKQKLKLIIKNIELLLAQLKVEVLSETSFSPIDEISKFNDYDEVFDDEFEV
jgi:hypothetical protein